MSSYAISLIPSDPFFVPEGKAGKSAERVVRQLVEENHEACFPAPVVEVTVTDGPQFVICVGNFESIHCPACDTELDASWWQDRMDDDFDGAVFKQFARFRTRCCGAETDLNGLRYNLPQGFARFVLSCREPGLADYPEAVIHELERLLRCELR